MTTLYDRARDISRTWKLTSDNAEQKEILADDLKFALKKLFRSTEYRLDEWLFLFPFATFLIPDLESKPKLS